MMNQPYNPQMLPVDLSAEEIREILSLEDKARSRIEKYNQMLYSSVIEEEILRLFSVDEAIQSLKIEGIQTIFDETIELEDIHYLKALLEGKELLKGMSFDRVLFFELHKMILGNSSAYNRNTGVYRKIQNFIGPTTNREDATYIPPKPDRIEQYMSNLEAYMNNHIIDGFGPIGRAAIIHGQLETIHPFEDGNGRWQSIWG